MVKDMKHAAKNLEAKMVAGFRDEGMARKKDYEGLGARMVEGFKNEEKERKWTVIN